MSFCENPIAAGGVGALEPLKSFDREATDGHVFSCATIQRSCFFRLIGSARSPLRRIDNSHNASRLCITGISIGMVFLQQLSVCSTNHIGGCISCHLKIVIVCMNPRHGLAALTIKVLTPFFADWQSFCSRPVVGLDDNSRYLLFPLIFLRRVFFTFPSQQHQPCSSHATQHWPKHATNSEPHHRCKDQYCANDIKWMISDSSFY